MASHYRVTYHGGASYHRDNYSFERGISKTLTEKEAKQFEGHYGFNLEAVAVPQTKASVKAAPVEVAQEEENDPAETDVAPLDEDAEPLSAAPVKEKKKVGRPPKSKTASAS